MTPRAFLFDIGNVLVRLDFPAAMRRLAGRSQATESEVPLLLATLRDEHERGLVSDGEFVSKSMKLIGFRGSEAEFSHIWCDIFQENTPMLETVRRLSGGHRLLHFSNTNGLHLAWLRERFGFFPLLKRVPTRISSGK